MPKVAKPNLLFILFDDDTCCLKRYHKVREVEEKQLNKDFENICEGLYFKY